MHLDEALWLLGIDNPPTSTDAAQCSQLLENASTEQRGRQAERAIAVIKARLNLTAFGATYLLLNSTALQRLCKHPRTGYPPWATLL